MFKQSTTTTGRVLRPRRSLVRYTIRPLLAATLAVGLLAGTTGATKAATNNVGRVEPGYASCYPTWIQVTFPIMSPAPLQRNIPAYSTSFPAQKVAWRANLEQVIGGRWARIRDGIWFTGIVGGAGDYGFTTTYWTTLSGGAMPSPLGFDRLPVGTKAAPIYLRVTYEYYWYADYYRDAGSGWSYSSGHQENRGSPYGTGVIDQTMYGYCKYPGPNWLL